MREYKPGAFGIILVHPYLTSQILDYQPADGQSQPRTLGIFIQFLETFKTLSLLSDGIPQPVSDTDNSNC